MSAKQIQASIASAREGIRIEDEAAVTGFGPNNNAAASMGIGMTMPVDNQPLNLGWDDNMAMDWNDMSMQMGGGMGPGVGDASGGVQVKWEEFNDQGMSGIGMGSIGELGEGLGDFQQDYEALFGLIGADGNESLPQGFGEIHPGGGMGGDHAGPGPLN